MRHGVDPYFASRGTSQYETVTDDDDQFNGENHIITVSASTNWRGSLSNLPVLETENNINYYYDYYVQEYPIPAGYEVVYYNNGVPVSGNASPLTNEQVDLEVHNRKLLNVPIEKYWADFSGEEFYWEADFQLEDAEVDPQTGRPSKFEPVPGRETLTVKKGQTPPVFEGLPMYRVRADGIQVRLQYSVSEIAYRVYDENSNLIARWEDGSPTQTIGALYEAQYVQDAGENGATLDQYEIKVANALKDHVIKNHIDATVNKEWPAGTNLTGASAHFVLKRYERIEHRDYSGTSVDTQWVDVTLRTGEGKEQTLRVPVNTQMHILGNIKPGMWDTNVPNIQFTGADDFDPSPYQTPNYDNEKSNPFDITFTAKDSGDGTMLVKLTRGDNYVVGGRDGFRLSDYSSITSLGHLDSTFEEHFTLNNDNWSYVFEYLPILEEQKIEGHGAQNIYVYSYYIEEEECTPADFKPVFKDGNGNTVFMDQYNQFNISTTFTAVNEQITTELALYKVDQSDLFATNPETLSGAAFTITKIKDIGSTIPDVSWGTSGTKVLIEKENEAGVYTCDGLVTGYYKISETKCPAGYIKTGSDPMFKIVLDVSGTNKKLKMIKIVDGNEVITDDETGMFRIPHSGTMIVGNEPGTELPSAGGPGTKLFYILGSILTIVAVSLLNRKRIRE